jgi:hypothetical protein
MVVYLGHQMDGRYRFGYYNQILSPRGQIGRRAGRAPGEFMETKLMSLKALWDTKRQERSMPSRDDFGIQELKPWLGYLALVDVTGEQTFRLCGTNLVTRFGGDMTGRRVAEVIAALQQRVTDQIANACETKAPVAVKSSIPAHGQLVIYSELILPLSQDGEAVSMLLWASYPTPQRAQHPSA